MNILSIIFVFLSWPLSFNDEAINEITHLRTEIREFYGTNLDSAALLAETILIKSKEAGYKLGQAKGEFAIAYVAHEQGKVSKAIPHFLEALSIYLEIDGKESQIDQANICITLGKIYRQHHNADKAIEFYELGIQYAIEANDNEALSKLLYNKSVAHRKRSELTEATDLLMQSLELTSEGHIFDKYQIYNQLGLIHRDLGEYDMARDWYDKIIQLESGPKYSRYRGQAYHNLANTYRQQGDYAMSWKYYAFALKEKEPLNKAKDLFITYHDMADLALFENKPELAVEFAKKAIPLLVKVTQTPENYNIYHILSRSLQDSDPRQAFAYNNLFVSENDSFLNRQKEFIANGDKYKVQLITSNYFNKVKKHENQIRFAWTMSCAIAFVFLAIALTLKLYRIYNYKSSNLALSYIKNPKELHYLVDRYKSEKDEIKRTLEQQRK